MAIRIRDNACLACGKRLDAVTGFNHKSHPRGGDVSLCLGCGHVMLFEPDGRLRNPTADELAKISKQSDVQVALWAISQMKQRLS